MNVRQILDQVCGYHGVSVDVVLRGRRGGLTTVARQQTIALARELTCASLVDIAEILNLSQVASVAEALRRHQTRLLDNPPTYARDFAAVRASLTES